MTFDERILGLALLLFGILVAWHSQAIPSVPGATFGPSLMPTIVGLLMAGCGLSIFIGGVRAADGGPLVDVSVWRGQRRGLACALWAISGVLVGILFMPVLGFPLFGVLYALPLMLLMRARPLPAAIVSVVVVLVAYFAFKRILFVPLPSGPLTFLG